MANEIYHRSNWGNAVNDKYWADVYEKYSATNKMYIRSDYYENSNETDKLMADIYPKPSILLTPTAYDNGSLHSVKPVKTFGSELISNGGFDTDSNWTKGTGWSISGGKASCDGTQTSTSTLRTSVGISGIQNKLVSISFELSNYSAGLLDVTLEGSGQIDFNDISSNGVYSAQITSSDASPKLLFNANADFIGSIDNVSVKEVTEADFDFTRGSSATRVNEKGLIEDVQILSGNLVQNGDFSQIGSEEVTNGDFSQIGSELVTNGDFATNSNWNFVGDGSISNGELILPCCISNNRVSQSIGMSSSKSYKLEINITEITSGDTIDFLQGGSWTPFGTQLGINVAYITNPSDAALFLRNNNGTGRIKIDNVSVKEVGQGWTLVGDFQIDDTKAFISNASQYSQITSQQGVSFLSNGKTYKLEADITTSINNALAYRVQGGAVTPISTSDIVDGKYTAYFTMTQNGYFWFQTTGAYTGLNATIDNVSVKEVGQNWTFGTGWSMGDGKAVFSDTANGDIRTTNIFTANNKYRINLTVSDLTSGTAFFGIGDGAASNLVGYDNYSNGDYNFEVTASNGQELRIYATTSSSSSFSIDNVSVIEITDDTDLPRINYTNFDYVDVLGDELVTNGYYEQSGIGNVISQSGGVLVNENNQLKISSNGSSAYSRGVWATGGLEGDTFLVEADIISTSGSVRFYDQSNNGTYTDLVVGSRYQRYIVLGSNDKNLGFGGNNDVNFELVLDNVSIKKFTEDVVVPYSGTGSLLLEPQRTNNVVNSNSSFITNNTTITYNNINSPEGIQNAFKVECTSSGTAVFARTNDISFTDETFSLFVKYGNTQYLQFLTSNTSAHFFNFDVQNGVFGTKGASTSNLKVVEYTNGWYRVSGYFTGGSGTGSFRVYLSNSNSASYGAASATSGDFLYSYGWQIENGSYPTSYIPTLNGSTVTRLADVCNNAGSSDLISSTSGVLYAEGYFEQTGLTNGLFAISDGTFNNFLMVRFGPINKLQIESTGGVNIIEPNARNSGNYKIAAKYDSNGVQLWVDGYKVIETSSQSTMSGVNQLMVGKSPYGNIVGYKNKCVAVFKEALDNDQLERLTGEGYESFNLLAQANNYTII